MPTTIPPSATHLHVHRRRNPLTGQWVLVSPQRSTRPWQGKTEAPVARSQPRYDPVCYLCPGNRRIGGAQNPVYTGTHVFDNDHGALEALIPGDPASTHTPHDALFGVMPAHGVCRVICFSPDHSLSLAELSDAAMHALIQTWCEQTTELGATHRWVQVFENKGELMGCSQPHPHGQVWATDYLPNEAATEDQHQREYLQLHGRPLLLDLALSEADLGTRVVVQTADWLAIVPWWASWPFETLLLPRFAVQRLPSLTEPQRMDLARMLRHLTQAYDQLFSCSFPYSMGWHGAPFGAGDHGHWQLHAHFYPPLLRSASVRKFMVGFEMLAESQRDLTPEQAAAKLRDAVAACSPQPPMVQGH